MQKVLVIGYVWPEPNSSAAGRHMMSILRCFKRQGWSVEFATPAQRSEHMINLSAEGISSQAIELNNDSFDHYVHQYRPTVVLFDRFMMEEQFGWRVEKHCPQAIKILDTEDLQCLRHARQQAYKANRELEAADLVSDISKREIAAILRCDLSLIISSYEMSLLQDRFKVDASLLLYLPFMVNLEAYPEQTKPFEQRQHFITIGNFRHAPNWDALLNLQTLWPLIRKQLPKAELHIYGAYPPPKATALHNPKTGFLIKGWADDAHTVMEKARVCLAPLRFGAGIKGKLLDAMLMQTPSITTSIGSEGMVEQVQQWPGVVSNDMAEFVQAAVSLYEDKALWLQAQSKAKQILEDTFDGQALSQQLLDTIVTIQQNIAEHRLNNFTGAMLKHHTMKSTQYMSQWIAAKNQ